MKKLLVLLALVLVTIAHAAPGGGGGGVTTPWFQTQWTANGSWVPVNAIATNGNLAQFTFPVYKKKASGRIVTSFLTTTTNFVGNHTGKTISATFTVTVLSGDPIFMFGGQLNNQGTGPGWNRGSLPPHCRLFFSTNIATYSNLTADNSPLNYWWSNPLYVEIDTLTGTATLTESLSGTGWSSANGIPAANAFTEFLNAVSNVRQIGLAFGGGSFFDVGVGTFENTGTASFTLNSFAVE